MTTIAEQAVLDRTPIYVDGQWVESDGTGRIDVRNPATGEVIATVAEGVVSDVDRAVRAAQAAFPAWSALSPVELSKACQIGLPIFNFGFYADLARGFTGDEVEVGNSLVVREPVGVVGCITPWNFPLHQVALKTAAALAAGCTVVVKPSEVAPLGPWAFAEVVHEAGLPPGVINIVSGNGPVVGEAIVTHPGVDMISFTGSTRAGRRIVELAAGAVKRVSLELGGKSAAVVLPDGDQEQAITHTLGDCFLNSDQLVPAARQGEAEAICPATTSALRSSPDHLHAHCAGGDLRAGAVDHDLRRRGRGRRDRQLHRLRSRRPRLVERPGDGDGNREAAPRRPGVDQRRAFNPAAPFGGYKQSSLGREAGTAGLDEFLETKAIQR